MLDMKHVKKIYRMDLVETHALSDLTLVEVDPATNLVEGRELRLAPAVG